MAGINAALHVIILFLASGCSNAMFDSLKEEVEKKKISERPVEYARLFLGEDELDGNPSETHESIEYLFGYLWENDLDTDGTQEKQVKKLAGNPSMFTTWYVDIEDTRVLEWQYRLPRNINGTLYGYNLVLSTQAISTVKIEFFLKESGSGEQVLIYDDIQHVIYFDNVSYLNVGIDPLNTLDDSYPPAGINPLGGKDATLTVRLTLLAGDSVSVHIIKETTRKSFIKIPMEIE